MDYNIKFSYKGIGKQAAGIRQKVLQAQKTTGAKAGVSATGARESITALRTLNSSILKLIASNKELARSMGKGDSGPPSGPDGGPAGFGRIGASIPIIGAGIAALGFTIQKVNQVGNAYIEKASQQIANVGISGFRRDGGIYTATQMGGGMKAYGMATGRFAQGQAPSQAALNVGAIYGLSAEETLRTAGQFQRAGANYQQAAVTGVGMGIESELPTLLTGMAGILADAVREGVNTSDMSKDMAREVSALAMATPGKSVEAALNIVKSFQAEKKQVAAGKMGTFKGLYIAKAAQQITMEKLTNLEDKENKRFFESIPLTEKQRKGIRGLKKGAGFEELFQTAPGAAHFIMRKVTAETGAPLRKRVMENVKKEWGAGAEGLQRFTDVGLQLGWGTQAQIETEWKTGKIDVEEVARKGMKGLAEKKEEMGKTQAVMGIRKLQRQERILFDHGERFAKASEKMEAAMIDLADTTMDKAVAGINSVGAAATALVGAIESLVKRIERARDKKTGELNLWDFATEGIFK